MNDIMRNNGKKCKNDLRVLASRTAMECQITPKNTYFQSCY
jgi:hypothetical protein